MCSESDLHPFNGLNLFDATLKIFKSYNKTHGLPDNVIYSTEEDKQGYLWISTNQGLSRYDPKAGTFKNYNVNDGLQSNEFNLGASFKSKTGELFFGGINGLNRFFPENRQDDIQPPKVVITNLLLLNKSVPIAANDFPTTDNQPSKKKSNFTLANAMHETHALILPHEENNMTFEFSALHFSNPKKNKFAYKLEGWDKDWVKTNYQNRRATYTNLPYGDYTLRVKASNPDGYWNEQGASLQLTVLAPPWRTWWAYSLYGLILLSLFFALFKWQRNKVLIEQRLDAKLESKVTRRTKELQAANQNLELANSQLEKLSLTDQLTGLKNRRFLLNNLQNDVDLILRKYNELRLEDSKENPEQSDLIFFLIDLDHFKKVNDIYGHTAGDAILMQIKSILEGLFRETDYLVRWGGEEFLVVVRFTDRTNASELAERLRNKIETHQFDIGQGNILTKTCSIGYACFPFLMDKPNCLDWEHVVDIADHCLYAAKKSSRNAWVGLENVTLGENNLFFKMTKQTQNLIDLKQVEVSSSITNKSSLSWD